MRQSIKPNTNNINFVIKKHPISAKKYSIVNTRHV
jgi:hypothetical protein